MNEAHIRAEHIAPLFAAAGWGKVENHFVGVSKMVCIGNSFKKAKLDRESNMQKMHIANSDKPVDLFSPNTILITNMLAG
jgi:hypothetical protein